MSLGPLQAGRSQELVLQSEPRTGGSQFQALFPRDRNSLQVRAVEERAPASQAKQTTAVIAPPWPGPRAPTDQAQ